MSLDRLPFDVPQLAWWGGTLYGPYEGGSAGTSYSHASYDGVWVIQRIYFGVTASLDAECAAFVSATGHDQLCWQANGTVGPGAFGWSAYLDGPIVLRAGPQLTVGSSSSDGSAIHMCSAHGYVVTDPGYLGLAP